MTRRKIVLIGAGSAVFTQGLVADFILSKDLGSWEIGLVDTNEKALESITKLTKKMVEEKKADIVVSTSVDRRKVLPGADVVVTTIAVGGRRGWEQDVFIPRKYGIFQPVGDTTMPGGISRALRMIPVMIDIAKDVKELCPEAYFFNYSNPMTAICQAVQRAVDINVIGLCHGVIHVEQYLAKFIGAKKNDVKSLGIGLNHLTFLYDLTVNGKDAWPAVKERLLEQKQKSGSTSSPNTENFPERGAVEPDAVFYGDNPFSWSLFERYGAFPAVLDRHVTEFFPERFPQGHYYGKVLGVDAYSLEAVIAEGDKIYQEMHEQAEGTLALNSRFFERSEGEHEQLVDILKSIYLDERKVFSVNLLNDGAVPNLPPQAVLELPAVATASGFKPLFVNDFSDVLASILRKRISVVDLTVEAALTGNRELVVEAMLADGAVQNEEMAKGLTNELLQAHQQYLPQFSF
jgi:alpha-galactosidase